MTTSVKVILASWLERDLGSRDADDDAVEAVAETEEDIRRVDLNIAGITPFDATRGCYISAKVA